MRSDVVDVVVGLIETYALHDRMPVKLEALEGMFPVRFAPLHERDPDLLGSCLPPATLPVTESNPARILIDDSLDENLTRLVYAHEIGHAVHGHPGELRLQGMDTWFRDKAERQAWEVAAMLLIPMRTIVGDAQQVAAITYVPEWLVRMTTPRYGL